MPVAIGALIGGLAGAGLASLTAGFISVATGWAIGSLIGQFLFAPSNDQVFTGPRLENTAPAVSNIIGSPIQIPYGTVRVPGSIIWSNIISEVVIKDKQSSGSGSSKSSSTTITYEYYLDFAVAICEGPIIGIKKIWANNKIIYDQDATVVQEPWLNYTLYLGNENQTADPTMESIIGAGKVPAYRDLAYIVFKQFKLEAYGNRAPYNVEFEVVASGSTSGPKTTVQFNPDYYASHGNISQSTTPIRITDEDFQGVMFGTPDDTTGFARIFNLQSPKGGFQSLTTDPSVVSSVPTAWAENLTASNHVVGLNREGDLVTFHFRVVDTYDGDGNTMISIYDTNGKLLDVRDTGWHHSGSFLFYNHAGFTLDRWWLELETEAGYQHYKFCEGSSSLVKYLPGQSNTYFLVSVTDSQVDITGSLTNYRIKTRRYDQGGTYGIGPGVYNNQDKWSYRRTFYSNKEDLVNPPEKSWWYYSYGEYDFYDQDLDTKSAKLAVTPWIYLDVDTFPAANANPACDNATAKFNKAGTLYTVLYFYEIIDVGTWAFVGGQLANDDTEWPSSRVVYAVWIPHGQTTATEWYQSDFTVSTDISTNKSTETGCMSVDKAQYHVLNGNYRVLTFDLTSHVWIQRQYTPSTVFNAAQMIHINGDRFLVSGAGVISNDWDTRTELIDLEQVASTSPTLSSIVSDISDRAGFNLSILDVSDLTSIYVPGYTIRDRETARKSIEDVTYPFFVDPVVSDWELKFKRRGDTAFTTIPYNDLGCTTSDYEEPYTLISPDENTLPKEIDFRYLGKLNNYQVSHQRAARSPKATVSEDKGTISTEVVLTDSYAKEVAVKFLANTWINSKRLNIKLPKKYSFLEPTDLIQMYTKDNLLINARIVEITNDYNILDINAELEYIETYESADYSEFAAGFDSSDVQKIPIISAMTYTIIDSYPIYDIFEAQQSSDTFTDCYIYAAGSSPFSSWPGGTAYLSQNNTDFSQGDTYTQRNVTGTLVSSSKSLTDVQNYKLIDVETEIVVDFVFDPVLTSITKEQLLAGGQNVLAIETTSGGLSEIIYAQTVSNVDNRYTFSNLLRGRYGSNSLIGNHATTQGNFVTVLNNTTVKPSAMPYGTYNLTYYYKAVTNGVNVEKVPSNSKYYYGRWTNSLPCDIINIDNDGTDISVDWVPIASFKAEQMLWSPLLDNTNFRMEVLDKDDVVLRTTDAITTNNYTYTAANMVTDSVTLDDILHFRMRRASNMRGYDTASARIAHISDTLEKTLNACTTSDAQILYDFTTQTANTFTDVVGTTSSNLVLNTGSAVSTKKSGLTSYSKKAGSFVFEKGTYYQTSSSTAGASSTQFSFMFIIKSVRKPTDLSSMKLLKRTTAGTYGTHSFGIQQQTDGAIDYWGDASGNVAELGKHGRPIMFVVTLNNTPSAQTELVYSQGALLETFTAGSFVSSWGGDFLLGDVNTDTNWKTESELQIDAFAYWNYTLTAAEVAAIWKAYNSNGGFKV